MAPIREQLAACEHALAVASDPAERVRKMERILSFAESLGMLDARLAGHARAQLLRLVFKNITIKPSGIASYQLNVPFDGLLTEVPVGHEPPMGAAAGHLDQTQSRTANIDIFEFDDAPLRRLID